MPSLRTAEVACEVTSIDKVGRLAVPGLLKYLAWKPGITVSLSEKGGLLLLTPDPQGAQVVTKAWHVCLPARVRHWHRLAKGTRLLLVADPLYNHLIVHPPAALDGVAQLHRSLLEGDAR